MLVYRWKTWKCGNNLW